MGEIHRTFKQLGAKTELFFMPQRGAFSRGIFTTDYTTFKGSLDEAVLLYQEFYRDSPFTHISDKQISLNSAVNTTNSLVHLYLHANISLIPR